VPPMKEDRLIRGFVPWNSGTLADATAGFTRLAAHRTATAESKATSHPEKRAHPVYLRVQLARERTCTRRMAIDVAEVRLEHAVFD
jgi:hypothetical protein